MAGGAGTARTSDCRHLAREGVERAVPRHIQIRDSAAPAVGLVREVEHQHADDVFAGRVADREREAGCEELCREMVALDRCACTCQCWETRTRAHLGREMPGSQPGVGALRAQK
eukprot:2392920-Rhodomonas_salina.1